MASDLQLNLQLDHDLLSLQKLRHTIEKAKKAQQELLQFSQEQVDQLVKAMAELAYEESYALAELAVKETGLGNVKHKVIKNQHASKGVYESIKNKKTVGIINEYPEKKILEMAAPFGLIAGITPVTNPTSTAIFKSLIAIKTRNAIIFSPHPSAKKCTIEAARICQQAILRAGGPDGLIGWIEEPSLELTDKLLKHKDIHLILATGGGALVKAAYSSGKPAYGVGPGNVPVYIEKTASISSSVKKIVESKTFDNGTICASEQAVVVDRNIQEPVIREFKKNRAYFLNQEEKEKVAKLISPAPGKINPKIVGKSAVCIAHMANVAVPEDTSILIAHEDKVGKDVPFSLEKLAPVFAFYVVNGHSQALERCHQLLDLGGKGHTLALHTNDNEVAKQFALLSPVSRIVVNTLSSIGAVGATTDLLPSMTLGCGTFGGNITSDNVSYHHLMNMKRLAYGTKEVSIEPAYPLDSPSMDTADEMEQVIEQVIKELDKRNVHVEKAAVIQAAKQLMKK